MSFFQGLRQAVLGAPLDPMSNKTRHSIALITFFAWVGLGADGISSSRKDRWVPPRTSAHREAERPPPRGGRKG